MWIVQGIRQCVLDQQQHITRMNEWENEWCVCGTNIEYNHVARPVYALYPKCCQYAHYEDALTPSPLPLPCNVQSWLYCVALRGGEMAVSINEKAETCLIVAYYSILLYVSYLTTWKRNYWWYQLNTPGRFRLGIDICICNICMSSFISRIMSTQTGSQFSVFPPFQSWLCLQCCSVADPLYLFKCQKEFCLTLPFLCPLLL